MTPSNVRKYFRAPGNTPVLFDTQMHMPMPGDFLLSSSGTAKLMQITYGYPISHCAVCLGGMHLAEALPNGFIETDMRRYSGARFVIVRWKGITKDQRVKLVYAAKDNLGDKYDYPQLTWLAVRGLLNVAALPLAVVGRLGLGVALKALSGLMNRRNLLDNQNKLICSEALYEASSVAGMPVDRMKVNKGTCAPAHFCNPELFDWVYIHWPGEETK